MRAPRDAGPGRLLAALTWVLLVLGLWSWARELTGGEWADETLGGSRPAAEGGAAAREPLAPLPGRPPPREVAIPSLGLRAEVVERGLDAEGGVSPPSFATPERVGWYADGPTPGQEGAAILVGHVDTEREPAVFHRLREVEPGSEVRVGRRDGSVAVFTVAGVEEVPRDHFDAERVYGPRRAGAAELRLITCGGRYDAGEGGYAANVVVSAYLTGSAR
ncbi:class F sortase [Streptomyces hoynatensis]|uniref:Class F sortase n=1 Tax=Streptomyces hoynatensis TaxID=1141874 RepID=A0A3A9YUM7_9ACTN|nr:class F sortase [Streptomyces hoynatensis]RKN39763.1 class F sortase [Streptomyces hoynatensis]